MKQFAIAVLLRHAVTEEARSIAVAVTCDTEEHAIQAAQAKALGTVLLAPGWGVEAAWPFDQFIVDAAYYGTPKQLEEVLRRPDDLLRQCNICGFTIDVSKGHVAPDPSLAPGVGRRSHDY